MGNQTAGGGEKFDGLLLIDKPAGMTSHDVVVAVRRAFPRKTKIGHIGTLDPIATGLLPVVVGKATRLSRFLTAAEKVYRGFCRFGWATDTYDREGAPTTEKVEPDLTLERIEAAVEPLTGEIQQVPPAFSAKKVEGKRMYELARAGKETAREPVPALVRYWKLFSLRDGVLEFEVACSSGTYVRSLAHDLGQALGCGAHVQDLRRIKVGDLDVAQAMTLEEVKEHGRERLLPLKDIPMGMGTLPVKAQAVPLIKHGQDVPFPLLGREAAPKSLGEYFRIVNERTGELYAIGVKARPSRKHDLIALRPKIVLI